MSIYFLSQTIHPNIIQLPGWTQGGSDGTNAALALFAVTYHTEATSLGVSFPELYQALKSEECQESDFWGKTILRPCPPCSDYRVHRLRID